jgi:tape measure domain-containing protein
MNGLGRSMNRAGLSAGQASIALAAVGAVAIGTAGKLVRSADAFTNLTNQTKVFAKSSGSAAFKMQDTINIARKMNSSLTEVGQVYQRISMVQSGAGFGDETTSKMVENLTKAVRLSGATAQEAEGALRQFSQGLAANRLSGQELNSVLEQTPMIAQVLAEGMNEPVGALRQLGKDGKITTDVLVRIFGGSIDSLNEKFKKFSFTIEAQMVSVNRELTLFAGMMMHAAGTAEGLGGAIDKFITKPLIEMNRIIKEGGPEAGKMMDNVEAAMVGAAAGVAILAAAVVGLTIVSFPLTSAFMAIVGVISLIVAGIYRFRNSTVEVFGSQISLMDVLVGYWNMYKLVAKTAFEAIVNFANWGFSKIKFAAKMIAMSIGPMFDSTVSGIKRAFNGTLDFLSAILNKMKKVSQFVETLQQADMGQLVSGDFLKGAWANAEEGSIDFAQSFEDKLKKGVEGAGNLIEGFVAPALETAMEVVVDVMAEAKRLAESAAAIVGRQHDEPVGVPAALGGGAAPDDEEKTEAANRTMEEIQAAGFMSPEELFNSMTGGLDDAKAHIFEFATSTRATIGEGLSGAFDLVTDSIVELATTGKANFKKFALAMLQMIQKIITQLLIQLAIQAALSAMGGSVGSVGNSAGGAPSMDSFSGGSGGVGLMGMGGLGGGGMSLAAGGGRVSGPVIVGERGPELFVPPQSGSIKNNTTTQGMMQQEAPQVTVVNVDSSQNTLDALGSEEGENLIMNVIQRNPEILRSLG